LLDRLRLVSHKTRVPGIKKENVAGRFYPANAKEIEKLFFGYQVYWKNKIPEAESVGAIVAPHAGYEYSGRAAWLAWKVLQQGNFKTIAVLAPSHYYPLPGFAVPDFEYFATPLGNVPVHTKAVKELAKLPGAVHQNIFFEREHSLEVQLPFLKNMFPEANLIPVIMGKCTPEEAAAVLENLLSRESTGIVVSSDLSHFHKYEKTKKIDAETADYIEHYSYGQITGDRACGYVPLRGLLKSAEAKQMQAVRLALYNSGDETGNRERVVGYGAWAFAEGKEQ